MRPDTVPVAWANAGPEKARDRIDRARTRRAREVITHRKTPTRANWIPLPSRARRLADDRQTDAIGAGLVNREVAVRCLAHVADHADAGGDGPALELLG